MYTAHTENGCDGWTNHTDLKTCKQYCEDNALPDGCKLRVEYVCRYVVWEPGSCHLARVCTYLPSHVEAKVFEYRRNGMHLKIYRKFLCVRTRKFPVLITANKIQNRLIFGNKLKGNKAFFEVKRQNSSQMTFFDKTKLSASNFNWIFRFFSSFYCT